MGLPNKKQLHKHKRGTRKALETLDAMENADIETNVEPDVEDLIKEKKSKKSSEIELESAEDENVQEQPVEEEKDLSQVQEKPLEEMSPELNLAENPEKIEESQEDLSQTIENVEMPSVESAAVEEVQQDIQSSEENEMNSNQPEKKSIDLGSLEDNPIDQNSGEVASNNETPVLTPPPDKLLNSTDEQTEIISEDTDKSGDEKKSGEPEVNREGFELSDSDEEFEDTLKDKFLTFQIGAEAFGIPIQFVTEIIVIHRITEVPDTPAFVRGVINLRGKVIPVIDVRHRFGMELRDYDDRTCIIVVDFEETAVGLIVDTVNEVVDIPEEQIDPPPRSHSGLKSSYIMGMGKINKQVNILLDLKEVLFVEEILAKRREMDDV